MATRESIQLSKFNASVAHRPNRSWWMLFGVVLIPALLCGETYYWTGAAESYDETAQTPKTSTVGNWTLENGSVPGAAPGVEDTLVFTNKASAGKNGIVYLHATSDTLALFAKIITRDDGLVTLTCPGTSGFATIPREGVWNYTAQNGIYFAGSNLKTASGESTAWCTSIVYVANANASVVNSNGKYAPGNYCAVVKRGPGLFQPVYGKKYGAIHSQIVEGGTCQIRCREISNDRLWEKCSLQFAGDDASSVLDFAYGAEFVFCTSLTEDRVTQTSHTLTDSNKGATLVLSNGVRTVSFESSRFTGVLGGTMSLAFQANGKPEKTLTLARGTSTSTGSLTVRNGTVHLTEGARYRTLSAVTVGNGDTTYAANLNVEDGASLKSSSLTINANGTLSIAKGLVVETDAFTSGGIARPVGLYTAADGVGIAGEGVLRVGDVNLAVAYDAAGKTATVRDMTAQRISHAGVAASGEKIAVTLSESMLIPDHVTNRIEVARYDAASGLLGGDFTDATAKTNGLPFTWFETEVKDDVLKVYLVSRPVITASFTEKGSGSTVYYYFMQGKDKEMWSDGLVPHAGADYLLAIGGDTKTVFYDTVENGETEFPGETLTVNASNYQAKNDRFKVNLRFYNQDNVDYRGLLVADNSCTRALSGTIWIDESCADMRITGGKDSVATVESPISGAADFGVGKIWSKSTRVLCRVYGDNNGLTGRFGIYGDSDASKASKVATVWNDITVSITNVNALGGAMASSTCDGVHAEFFPKLQVCENVVFDTLNRHLYGKDGLRVEVAEGKTFAVENTYRCYIGYTTEEISAMTNRCCIEKSGAGVLALTKVLPCKDDASFSTAAATGTNNLVRVVEGGIRALAADTFDDLVIAFSNRTSVVIDPEDVATAAYGLRVTGYDPVFEENAKVYVALAADTVPRVKTPYAFLTAPVSAGDLTTRFAAKSVRTGSVNYRGVVQREPDAVSVNGVACHRYTVTYSTSGLWVIFR